VNKFVCVLPHGQLSDGKRCLSSVQGQWAAVGGSLLWDAREHEVSSMRLALCAQPATNQQVALSFDHTGRLSGSITTVYDSLSARLFGTLDLNRKNGSRAGLEVTYDSGE
jgi:hypothetical protein